jgi:hypothetical protein
MIYSNEIDRLKPFLTAVALEYLRAGEYDTVATFGGEALTPNQRRLLDQLREDPTSVSASRLMVVSRRGVAPQSLEGAVSGIIRDRETAAEELSAATEIASTPSPNRPPAGPLPANQEYVYDYSRKVWMVVEGGTKFITDVNQQGRSVPASAPEGEEPPTSGSTVYSDPLGRPTVGLGFGRGERTYDYGDIELQALGGDVAEGIAAVTGGTTTPSDDGAVTDIAETPADINIPEDWRNAAAEAYPQYYAIVRNVPEIARLLEEAIANTYTPEQFQAKLEQTSWWQQTTASAREWDINGQRDPATQQTLIDNKRVEVRNLALSAFGVQLSDEKLEQLTVDSLRFGWSYNFLQNAIGDVATQSTVGISQLRQGYIGQTIRQTAKRYGVALADETFNSFVNRIAVGQETTDSFENYASNIARSLYPTLTAQFDSGLTFEDAVSPYRQVAANLLELNPNDIDFMDPKWLTPITYMPDPQSGEQRLMNLAEWGQELRTNKAFGYEFTNQARETAYRVTTDLANLFGRV